MKFLITQTYIVDAPDLMTAARRLLAYESDIAYRQVQKGHKEGIFKGPPEVDQIVSDSIETADDVVRMDPKVVSGLFEVVTDYIKQAQEHEDGTTLTDPVLRHRLDDFRLWIDGIDV